MLRSVEMEREGCGSDVKGGWAVLIPAFLVTFKYVIVNS